MAEQCVRLMQVHITLAKIDQFKKEADRQESIKNPPVLDVMNFIFVEFQHDAIILRKKIKKL